MLTNEIMRKQGQWLFRWRSYLPLLFLIFLIPAFRQYRDLFENRYYNLFWEMGCLAVGLTGLGIRAATVGYAPRNTSGRHTREQMAEALNTKGMYSLLRNPLYFGNFFLWSAPVLFLHNLLLSLAFILIFVLYYERIIIAEEMFLQEKFGEMYTQWVSQTPVWFPRHFRWQKPDIFFSWKTVIRREYHGFFGLIAAMTVMKHVSEIFLHQTAAPDQVWTAIFAVGTGIYLGIRFLAKQTKVLHVEGR
ncbi:MAG: hypothetical protein LBQ54_02450 [Planctomycetaceae bacterium]|jgi:protein-S-isoprenylcysteine O-methyltransferase Ste14|nr:hypothetical protein [Planctomycetaceae bacterium]